MDVVIRKRVLAEPSGSTSSVSTNIGTNYSYTEGAVFRLYTNTNNAPGTALTDSWATCTVLASSGTCTITIPSASTSGGSGNAGKRFWVVEEAPVAGSPAAQTYSNDRLYLGDYENPMDLRRIVGLTQAVAGNQTNNMPMTAANVSGGTVITASELPGSSATVTEAGSFGAAANSLSNPDIQPKCAPLYPNIAIVIDESSSISQSDWDTFRTALVGTGSGSVLGVVQDKAAISILGFGPGSYWRYGQGGPTLVTAANRTAIANSIPTTRPARAGTNWDAALSTIQDVNASHKYDMVLFVTDGAPNFILGGVNTSGTNVASYEVNLRALEAPAYAANALKAAGTRVVAVGVGDGATSDRVGLNIRSISGVTKNSDYFQGNWSELNQMLADVMKAATCTVPVEVSKTTIDGSTTTTNAAGWKFTASKTGQGTLVGPTPANGTTTAGATGTVKWDLNFSQPTGQSANLTLKETTQSGWMLTGASCTVDGVDRAVTITDGAVSIAGLTASSGKVYCTFTNEKVNLGALTITKAFDSSVPQGSGTNVTFTGTYTCTLNSATVASGTWSRTGTGAATLTPASGSPAANQIPVGASCSATENTISGSAGLPNGSYQWGTATLSPANVTIATGKTSDITVTNKAERIYGNFSVTKVLATGSTADSSNQYSGDWSCSLGSETKTGTWGPIAAGGTWTSTVASQIPLGADCKVTSENRPDHPVADNPSFEWDGAAGLGSNVTAAKDNLATVTVTNTTKQGLGSVIWTKVAAGTDGELLAGSTWTLTGPNVPANTVLTDCEATPCPAGSFKDQDPVAGAFLLIELPAGDYTLTEKSAPPGYQLVKDPISFTVVGGSTIELDPIENTQQDGAVLPLTGGMGRDAFLIGGTGLLLIAAGALVIRQRRTRRVQQG